MKTIYGRNGNSAGSTDGAAIYNRDGDQIGFLEATPIYAAEGGEWLGSMVSGVVYNAFGDPEAFTIGCSQAVPPAPPKLRSMLPPRLKSIGPNVRGDASAAIPDFLSHMPSIPPRQPWAGHFL